MGLAARAHAGQYERGRAERTALYEVVRDNLETLYGAIDDGALDIKLAKHAKKELEAYLDCGLLCRGFARLRLRYVLRPPVGQERIEPQKDGLIAITLKRAYADGTVAVVMDPLSLLCRLAMSVPPPRYHTVKYAGVLASASPWRPRSRPLLPLLWLLRKTMTTNSPYRGAKGRTDRGPSF